MATANVGFIFFKYWKGIFIDGLLYNNILLKHGYVIISYTVYHGLVPLSGFDS